MLANAYLLILTLVPLAAAVPLEADPVALDARADTTLDMRQSSPGYRYIHPKKAPNKCVSATPGVRGGYQNTVLTM